MREMTDEIMARPVLTENCRQAQTDRVTVYPLSDSAWGSRPVRTDPDGGAVPDRAGVIR